MRNGKREMGVQTLFVFPVSYFAASNPLNVFTVRKTKLVLTSATLELLSNRSSKNFEK